MEHLSQSQPPRGWAAEGGILLPLQLELIEISQHLSPTLQQPLFSTVLQQHPELRHRRAPSQRFGDSSLNALQIMGQASAADLMG
jgi:hypothetical protein